MDMINQASALAQRPHIVIATPGRLADILADPLNNVLKRVKVLVLDEADRLLDSSFEPALAVIFGCLPPSRRTLLFSATITDAITQLRALSHVPAFEFDTGSDAKTVEGLTQKYVIAPMAVKDAHFMAVIKAAGEGKGGVIVFCARRNTCEIVATLMQQLGCSVAPLHAGLNM
jgi:ATP-dependent RNA helicase DDX49/DBP8